MESEGGREREREEWRNGWKRPKAERRVKSKLKMRELKTGKWLWWHFDGKWEDRGRSEGGRRENSESWMSEGGTSQILTVRQAVLA
jgi:hypothetical protein